MLSSGGYSSWKTTQQLKVITNSPTALVHAHHVVHRWPDFSLLGHSHDYTSVIDAVFISHFHMDHVGALPYFTEVQTIRSSNSRSSRSQPQQRQQLVLFTLPHCATLMQSATDLFVLS